LYSYNSSYLYKLTREINALNNWRKRVDNDLPRTE